MRRPLNPTTVAVFSSTSAIAVLGGLLAQKGHEWLSFVLGCLVLVVVLIVSVADIISRGEG